MINISEQSLLTRLALYTTGFNMYGVKENLCPFIRQVIVGFGLCCLLVLGISIAIMFFIFPFFGTLLMWAIHGYSDTYFFSSDGAAFHILGAGYILLTCLITGTYLRHKYKNTEVAKLVDNTYTRVTATPLVKIVTAYWNAIHDKMCPSINFYCPTEETNQDDCT